MADRRFSIITIVNNQHVYIYNGYHLCKQTQIFIKITYWFFPLSKIY